MKNSGNLIHFASLGCSRNLVDSELMLGLLLKEGYDLTQEMSEADFLIVNTCGFLEASRDESLDVIDEFFTYKKPDAKVIVTGCMAQKFPKQIEERFPEVHALLGSGDIEKIVQAVRSLSQTFGVTDAKSYLQQGDVPRIQTTPPHYAYLKIAEGCLKRCSFCIIPTIKGHLKSKPQEQVLKEFKALLASGVHEVILIAQDLGDYGKERREKGAFTNLVKKMLEVDQDFWIRFLYLYPDEIDDELIAVMKSDPRICPYLDMPIQHVNNDILRLMRRKTSKEDIISIITKLRDQIPDVVIRTSLMVGFPGETEDHFEELLEFIQNYPLDNVGAFTYSNEKDAFSAKLSGHLSDEVKTKRYEKLMQTQLDIVKERQKKYIGQTLRVMVEGYHPETDLLLVGRFYGQCPEIDGKVIINDFAKVDTFSSFYQVEITDIAGYDLIGKVIAKEKQKNNLLAIV
jgi:ribosomal protein S12 methylthiotransferase